MLQCIYLTTKIILFYKNLAEQKKIKIINYKSIDAQFVEKKFKGFQKVL